MAPGVELWGARVLGPGGSGQTGSILAAIDDCAAGTGSGIDGDYLPKMDVINLSLGNTNYTAFHPMHVAVNNAVIAGVNVVISAGNDGSLGRVNSPGGAYLPITVAASVLGGASTSSNQTIPAFFSSRGPVGGTSAIKPDIIAPGVDIYSTIPPYSVSRNNTSYDNAYGSKQGTSMSAPHIAGIVALMVEAFPNATPQEIKSRLMNTADPDLIRSDVAGKTASVFEVGAGFVDPYRAIITERNVNPNVFFTVEDQIPMGSTATNPNWQSGHTLSSLSFGHITEGTVSRELTITAHGVASLTDDNITVVYHNNTNYSENAQLNGITLEYRIDGNTITAWVSFGETIPMNGFYEGRIEITVGGQIYVVPWAVDTNIRNTVTFNLGEGAFSGARSAYISNDGGFSNSSTSSQSTVYMYRDVTFPASTDPCTLIFDWRARGLGSASSASAYLIALLIDTTGPLPALGSINSFNAVPSGTLGIYHRQNSEYATIWNREIISIPVSNYETTKRLVFAWHNSGSINHPPAAVDDIILRGPEGLIFYEGFEGETHSFTIVNGDAQANQWHIGTATSSNWRPDPITNILSGSVLDTTQRLNPADFVRTNLVNDGKWYTNAAATNEFIFGEDGTPVTEDMTLYLKWTSVYTISFDLNGGTGTPPASINVTGDSTLGAAQRPATGGFVRNGIANDGKWYTDAAGRNEFVFGTGGTPVTRDMTLYLKWPSYTVSFDLTGGTFSGTKSAYISNNNGVTNTYATNSASITHIYRDVTFPASTEPYTLSFDWKAEGESISNWSYDYLIVSLIETTDSLPAPGNINASGTTPSNRLGIYNMGGTGWNQANINIPASNSGTTKRLVFTWRNDNLVGAQPPAAIDNILLTSSAGIIFREDFEMETHSFTIVNGIQANRWHVGTATSSPAPVSEIASLDVFQGSTLNAAIPPAANITRTGFINDGKWYTDAAGTNEFILGEGGTAVTEDITLYLRWASSHTVSFDLGGGTVPGGVRSAYISNNAGFSNSYSIISASTVHIHRDVTLPASAEPYTLSFDWKSRGENTVQDYDFLRVFLLDTTSVLAAGSLPSTGSLGTYKWNDDIWERISIVIPVSNNGTTRRLVFTWRNNPNSGTQPPAAIDNILLASQTDTIFYENFEGETHSFDILNGTQPNQWHIGTATSSPTPVSVIAAINVYPGSTLGTAQIPPATGVTRPGFVNNGRWYTDVAGTNEFILGASGTQVTADITLYLRWTSVPTVTFNLNGGTGTAPAPVDVHPGPTLGMAQRPATHGFKKDGFVNDGKWYTDDEGINEFIFGENGTQVTGDITLYLKWTRFYTVSFDPAGATFVGASSAYISNDDGASNAYTPGITSITHIYRDVTFPPSAEPYTLTFDWRAQGLRVPNTDGSTTNAEFLRVFLVPTSEPLPTPGSGQLSSHAIGTTYLMGGDNWNQASISINASNSGATRRLVFMWQNGHRNNGVQPPAAIDNIMLVSPTDTIFREDFERGAHSFTAINGTQRNQWHVGTAASSPTPITVAPVDVLSGSTISLGQRPTTQGFTNSTNPDFINTGKWYMDAAGTNEFIFGENGTPVTGNITLYLRWRDSSTVAILSPDREIPPSGTDEKTAVVIPPAILLNDFTAGPNPVERSSGRINFFWQGRRVNDAILTVFDASGNVVNQVTISDVGAGFKPALTTATPIDSRRIVGSWDLTDSRGRLVSEGTYLVRGTITTLDGKQERVSVMIGVR
jgi:hypothetical protein